MRPRLHPYSRRMGLRGLQLRTNANNYYTRRTPPTNALDEPQRFTFPCIFRGRRTITRVLLYRSREAAHRSEEGGITPKFHKFLVQSP